MSELLKINVNERVEKKGGLSYLSWAWAWAEVLKIDPQATWVAHLYGPPGAEQPCMWIGDTAIVHTSVIINGQRRECMLPVMDNRNNAVKNPDARKISDAIMRCMTKTIALHGLGLYIYAGEDLPEDSQQPANDEGPVSAARLQELQELAADMLQLASEDRGMEAVKGWYALTDNDEKIALWGMLRGEGKGSTPESRLRALIKANSPHAA